MPATDVDPFADPVTDFADMYLNMEDLLGRTVIVVPTSIETRPSTMPGQTGKTFDVAVSDVIVLDGPLNEKIGSLPHIAQGFWVTGSAVVNMVRSKVGTGQPVIGHMTQVPSKTKGFGPRYELEKVGDDVKSAQSTRAAWKLYKDQVEIPPF